MALTGARSSWLAGAWFCSEQCQTSVLLCVGSQSHFRSVRDSEDLAYIVVARLSEFQEFTGDSQPLEYLEFLSVQARFIVYFKCCR